MLSIRRCLSLTTVLLLTVPAAGLGAVQAGFAFEVPDTAGTHWYRGNTHAHTLESDGDSPPEVVARWYQEHGYDFLVLSDHNVLTDPEALADPELLADPGTPADPGAPVDPGAPAQPEAPVDAGDDGFLLIAGEEVSSSFEGHPVHVNGLNIREVVEPQQDSTLVGTIQRNVDAIREVEGVPHINHPNFRWAISAEDLAQVENERLLEIYNGHPDVNNEGGGDALALEAVWDYLLTRGKRIYGIAVDDAHNFQEYGRDLANPGRGWVSVRATELQPDAIVAALEQGQFYASTGVFLDDVVVEPRRLIVCIAEHGDFRYTTTFIGAGGRVLATTGDNPAVFDLQAPELYVRARVKDSRGDRAWVQPVFVAAAEER